jgi:hypothetical protein
LLHAELQLQRGRRAGSPAVFLRIAVHRVRVLSSGSSRRSRSDARMHESGRVVPGNDGILLRVGERVLCGGRRPSHQRGMQRSYVSLLLRRAINAIAARDHLLRLGDRRGGRGRGGRDLKWHSPILLHRRRS